MGWFDEQIKQRIQNDDEMLEDAFVRMANLVSDKKIADVFADDCRLAEKAISDILNFYHVKAQEVPDNIKNVDEILEFLLRPSGIMRRPVRLSKGWYRDAVGAMLGTTKDGKVVALIPDRLRGYRYRDAATGEFVKINHKNRSDINEEAICFYMPFPLRKMTVKDLLVYIFRQLRTGDYVFMLAAAGLTTGMGMLTPAVNRFLYGDVLDYGSRTLLIGAILSLLCITLSSTFFSVVRSIFDANISTKISLSVESAAMMRVLSLPTDFFKQYSSGELTSRLGYISSLSSLLMGAIFSTGLSAVMSLAYIGQVFVYAPSLVVPALTVTLVTVVISVITTLLQMNVEQKRMLEAGKESGMVLALINGVTKIKNAGAEKRAFARWSDQYIKAAGYIYRPRKFTLFSGVITTAISLTGTIVLYYGAVSAGISVADYVAFNSAYSMVSGAFTSFAAIAVSIAAIRPILNMVRPLFETAPEVDTSRHVVTGIKGNIELNNVSFRYKDGMPNVLDNISLKIRAGQYVAIVGKTGCGKSTLLRLLLGFEKPQKGAVYIDGRDISTVDLKSLRQRIGVVMQNGKLFQGDIFSNIIISAPSLTLDEAWEAAGMAGMADDIRQMPMGMNTVISEGQGGISGGQKQRLMIARAIAPKPKVLMLDEATSALDNITQKVVSDSLDKLKCTRIVIAHRLSTIRHCDRIIVLDGGKIVEDGSYDELIDKGGYFGELVARQRVDA